MNFDDCYSESFEPLFFELGSIMLILKVTKSYPHSLFKNNSEVTNSSGCLGLGENVPAKLLVFLLACISTSPSEID